MYELECIFPFYFRLWFQQGLRNGSPAVFWSQLNPCFLYICAEFLCRNNPESVKRKPTTSMIYSLQTTQSMDMWVSKIHFKCIQKIHFEMYKIIGTTPKMQRPGRPFDNHVLEKLRYVPSPGLCPQRKLLTPRLGDAKLVQRVCSVSHRRWNLLHMQLLIWRLKLPPGPLGWNAGALWVLRCHLVRNAACWHSLQAAAAHDHNRPTPSEWWPCAPSWPSGESLQCSMLCGPSPGAAVGAWSSQAGSRYWVRS